MEKGGQYIFLANYQLNKINYYNISIKIMPSFKPKTAKKIKVCKRYSTMFAPSWPNMPVTITFIVLIYLDYLNTNYKYLSIHLLFLF